MMQKIDELRELIEKIDITIIEQLAAREKLVKEIGLEKSRMRKAVFDGLREEKLMQLYQALAEMHQLDVHFVQGLFGLIIAHSRDLQ